MSTTTAPDRRTRYQQTRDRFGCACPTPSLCICLDYCECGAMRGDHEYDYATDTGPSWGVSLVEGSTCRGFVVDEEREGE